MTERSLVVAVALDLIVSNVVRSVPEGFRRSAEPGSRYGRWASGADLHLWLRPEADLHFIAGRKKAGEYNKAALARLTEELGA
ncbi:hypothetical protein [Actinomyces sp. W5033]|uniref:hypothetical protein n=1 Tax=Actinomyces sp. W5033 TaxID=3446479 RepID=UPI003EE0E63C